MAELDDQDDVAIIQIIIQQGRHYLENQIDFLTKTVNDLRLLDRHPFCPSKVLADEIHNIYEPLKAFNNQWNPQAPSIVYRPAWEAQKNLRTFATNRMTIQMINEQLPQPLTIKKSGHLIIDIANNIRWFCVSWASHREPNNVGLEYMVPNVRNPRFPHKVYMSIDPNLPPSLGFPRAPVYAIEVERNVMMRLLRQIEPYVTNRWPNQPLVVQTVEEMIITFEQTIINVMQGDFQLATNALDRSHQFYTILAQQCPPDPEVGANDFPNNQPVIEQRFEAVLERIQHEDIE